MNKSELIDAVAAMANASKAATATVVPNSVGSGPWWNAGWDFRVPVVVSPGTIARTDHIAEVLLDQRIACGVGNVYKSEMCFHARLSPLHFVLANQTNRLIFVRPCQSRTGP